MQTSDVLWSVFNKHVSVCGVSSSKMHAAPCQCVLLGVVLCAAGVCACKCCLTCTAFLSLSCCCPRSIRESCRSLLPPSSSLSQRDAKAYRSVCQNQRCLGNPSRIPAVDQETGKWAVWGSMDGYAKPQLLYYQHPRLGSLKHQRWKVKVKTISRRNI